jgi:hypothetical protein
VTIAGGSASRNSAFDVVRLRPRFVRNRIARQAGRTRIAFTAVLHERHRHSRLIAGDDDVGNAVGGRAEIRVQSPDGPRIGGGPAADPVDQLGRPRVDRCDADVGVPPVARGKHLAPQQRLVEYRSGRGLRNRNGGNHSKGEGRTR